MAMAAGSSTGNNDSMVEKIKIGETTNRLKLIFRRLSFAIQDSTQEEERSSLTDFNL
ncbi:hypothetical protein JXJ21_25855 [candidate division KSB1 bacterium]|nr:hypothetical protein [candidate division KSB1 bacterium]